ncbi:hypothetical protein [uncultured Photobacterium sp.]|uniref:hypothetical protein n=1 Tax=uncultured Photobacterium sp. TaxID=173973 RepID=UPI00261D9A30|nr:hypothetical protein [uncultured Photobacterium sp.]
MNKKLAITFLLAAVSQSAHSETLSFSQPVLDTPLAESVQMISMAHGNNWGLVYDYATKQDNHYDVKFRVTPNPGKGFGTAATPEVSNMVIGPFAFAQSMDAYKSYEADPAKLKVMLAEVLPTVSTIVLDGKVAVSPSITDVSYDEKTHETVVSFSFDSDENITYLPKTAGFVGIWTQGVQWTTLMGRLSAGDSFTCDKVKCYDDLRNMDGMPDYMQQNYAVTELR